MVEQARRRNRAAIEVGLVELKLGGLELLPRFGEASDKVFSVNVPLFLSDQSPALHQPRSALKPGGLLATKHQPRHVGATAEDARAFGDWLSSTMRETGFRGVSVAQIKLKPVPAVCVMSRK